MYVKPAQALPATGVATAALISWAVALMLVGLLLVIFASRHFARKRRHSAMFAGSR